MIGATAAAAFFDLVERANISVLGSLPRGLPTFSIPWVPFDDLVPLVIGGFAVSLVSFADTSVLSRTYAVRTGSRVDPNQEMIGLGAANLAAGLFQGFPVSSSSSRTPVAEAAGSRTQLTGVVGALLVALLLLSAPDLLKNVPTAALAAVVISSAIGLFEVSDLRRIFKIQRWEFWLSMACFAGVAVFGAIEGVGIAVVIAVIEFLWDGWRPTPRCWDGWRGSGAIMTSRAIPMPANCLGSCCSAGTRLCFSPTRSYSRIARSPL
jgi:MFS superfamily sulfate permease-like transporter